MKYYPLVFLLELIFLFFVSRKVKRNLFSFFKKLFGVKWSLVFYSIIFLPGTFIHELSHFIFSLILFVPAGKISLIPKLEGNRLELGNVEIRKTDIVRGTVVGIAPFIVGNIILFVIANYFSGVSIYFQALFVYLIFAVANTMFLSLSDLKDFYILLIVLVLTFSILYFLGLRLSISTDSIFIKTVVNLSEKVSKYLLFPLVIDSVIVFLYRLCRIKLNSKN